MLKSTLQQTDPEIYNIIQEEAERQEYGIELIASENYTSKAVMEAMGSVLTNKYSEGYVGSATMVVTKSSTRWKPSLSNVARSSLVATT